MNQNQSSYNPMASFAKGLRPVQMLTCDVWADRYRWLTTEGSAEPGLWSTDRTPYLREILQNLSPRSDYKKIVVAKGVQLGFTESGLNCVGTYIDIDPCSILYVMPTIKMADGFSKERVMPMIENSPALKAKIKPNRSRDSGNTLSSKKFPGGQLVLGGANSAASLRSRPIRVLIFDEVDAADLDVDGEGSPLALAEKRTNTFDNKKIYVLSTPTIEGQSVIWKEYEDTDRRRYFVPCPNCGEMQELIFDRLRWEPEKYDAVKYECVGCNELIDEKEKTDMLLSGKWIPTAEHHDKKKAGYHINSLYSPVGWLSWGQIAQEWDKIEKTNDENLRKTFMNTILALPYSQKGEAPAWNNLYNRREKYLTNQPPADVCFITAGADVQKDRIEVEIVGWAKSKRAYSIDYRVLHGNTNEREVWDELGKALSETWQREDGIQLGMRLLAVDSGFNTQFVYDFCRRYDPTKVIPIKGQDKQAEVIKPPKHVDVSFDGKKVGSVLVWHVGVSVLKSELYGFLRLEIGENGEVPDGYCHFPEYAPDYFKGLTAEVLVPKEIRGFVTYQWEKKFERNEPLDCRVYARAAASVLQIDRMQPGDYDKMSGTARKEKKKPKNNDDFW